MVPYLQAEADMEYIRRERDIMNKQLKIMIDDHPKWRRANSQYFGNLWSPPKISDLDRNHRGRA